MILWISKKNSYSKVPSLIKLHHYVILISKFDKDSIREEKKKQNF